VFAGIPKIIMATIAVGIKDPDAFQNEIVSLLEFLAGVCRGNPLAIN
jgi:hypothetical protein